MRRPILTARRCGFCGEEPNAADGAVWHVPGCDAYSPQVTRDRLGTAGAGSRPLWRDRHEPGQP